MAAGTALDSLSLPASACGWRREEPGDDRVRRGEDGGLEIDVRDLYYRQLNEALRRFYLDKGETVFRLRGVSGQRYLGASLGAGARGVRIQVFGTPGQDLGAFMDGPAIEVFGNAQDGTGNTMNDGRIVIHGNAGDVTGMSMRGGQVFIRGDVGYRTAIHMKEYGAKKPLLVIGGTAQDFLGEYMAGGTLVLLGLTLPPGVAHRANFIGTGMHGGAAFIRGRVEAHQLGKEVGAVGTGDFTAEDRATIETAVRSFAGHFQLAAADILAGDFIKLYPKYLRPYGTKYAY